MKRYLFILLLIPILLISGCTSYDPITDDLYIRGNLYTYNGTAYNIVNTSLGSGDVVGINASDDNAIARYDGVTGKRIQNSDATISDFGVIDTPGDILSDSDINAGNDVNVGNDLDVTDDADIGGELTVGNEARILGNYAFKWMDATDTTTKAYIHYDGNLTVREIDAGSIILEPDSGNITANAKIYLSGDGRVEKCCWIEASAIKAPGAKPATETVIGTMELDAWRFADQALLANQESITFSIKVPGDMDRTVAPELLIGWSADVIVGDVVWQLEYLWTSPNESTWAAAQETLTTTSTVSGTQYGLDTSTITGIDTPSATDVCLHCKLTRKSADASDTMTDDADLLGVCFIYTADRLGG